MSTATHTSVVKPSAPNTAIPATILLWYGASASTPSSNTHVSYAHTRTHHVPFQYLNAASRTPPRASFNGVFSLNPAGHPIIHDRYSTSSESLNVRQPCVCLHASDTRNT